MRFFAVLSAFANERSHNHPGFNVHVRSRFRPPYGVSLLTFIPATA